MPVHVIQRGVNRCAIFLDDEDRRHYLRVLREACRRHGVCIHAYALMDNHVHLLLTASAKGALALAMRRSGQAHVQAFNARHGRSGPLWQGRYKSCLVESDEYALAVMRYIDLNPIRAALVAAPQQYRWSSARFHLGLVAAPWLSPCPTYLALGSDRAQCARRYRDWLEASLHPEELAQIRNYANQERAWGSPRFQAMVERALNRPVVVRKPGRPRFEPSAAG